MKQPVPLFPLPNHVVLPYTAVPYKLFEERYRALGAYLLQHQEQGLFIPCLEDGWESDYDGNPSFQPLAIHCEIQAIEKSAEGDYALIVQGTQRYRLRETPSSELFRFAHAELEDTLIDMSNGALQQGLLGLASHFRKVMTDKGAQAAQLKQFFNDCTSSPQLLNRMAHLLFSDPILRQQFLDAPAISDQLALIRIALGYKSNNDVSLN